jgi:4-carboxymuconolactone decarboxylase
MISGASAIFGRLWNATRSGVKISSTVGMLLNRPASPIVGLYARFQSSLTQRLSELCILMMASHWKAAGEWIDHSPIATSLGVDPIALENLRQEKPAIFKQKDEVATYELAQELLKKHDVSDATYEKAKAALGERGVLDVIAVLGYYSFIAMSMKAFKMKPDGADPFADRQAN